MKCVRAQKQRNSMLPCMSAELPSGLLNVVESREGRGGVGGRGWAEKLVEQLIISQQILYNFFKTKRCTQEPKSDHDKEGNA